MYKLTYNDRNISWALDKPLNVEGITAETFDYKLKVGNVQSMIFDSKQNDPLPPFNDITAPLEDMPLLVKKGEHMITKSDKVKEKEGYANKTKGVAQVLWERGLWIENMKFKLDVGEPNYPDMSASTVLANCGILERKLGHY